MVESWAAGIFSRETQRMPEVSRCDDGYWGSKGPGKGTQGPQMRKNQTGISHRFLDTQQMSPNAS